MNKPAAQFGDYIDLRFMPGLKVARVFTDIPIEHANEFLKMFGAPDRANPVKVIIARYNPDADDSDDQSRLSGDTKDDSGPPTQGDSVLGTSSTATKGEESADKPTSFRDKPRSVQAALMCRREEFRIWLLYGMDNGAHKKKWDHALDSLGGDVTDIELHDYVLKMILDISSKRELDTPGPKAEAWDKLLTDFDTRGYAR